MIFRQWGKSVEKDSPPLAPPAGGGEYPDQRI
jgi:hypothetical protein